MKNPFEFLRQIPKELVEIISFLSAVLVGSVYKMIKQNEKGVKITLKRIILETFTSFFIALLAFAVFDQYCSFNKLFTYMLCSLAGSMSSNIHTKLEALLDVAFNIVKIKLKR